MTDLSRHPAWPMCYCELAFWLACGTGVCGPGLRCASALDVGAEEKQAPILSVGELQEIRETFQRLAQAFLAEDGNAGKALDLFVAADEVEEERKKALAQALEREFATERFTAFEILDSTPDATAGPQRYMVWVRLRYELLERARETRRGATFNGFFLLEQLKDGRFALVDAPFFDTLGQHKGMGLVADAILVTIAFLAGLSFWVWMGFEAWWLRPRSPFWRVFTCLPLLGALVFFLAVYVPLLRKGPTSEPE